MRGFRGVGDCMGGYQWARLAEGTRRLAMANLGGVVAGGGKDACVSVCPCVSVCSVGK